jgi:hypothetical protein
MDIPLPEAAIGSTNARPDGNAKYRTVQKGDL